ncbi:hypothetical protein, partial [Escherichia coli]|uniref:hypothetical protein n=1 Tax=Escherichia coli TaxID=562 RepID=UPI003F2581B7
AGTADIRRAPAATAAEHGVGEWLGTTLSHSFDGQPRFVNFQMQRGAAHAALRNRLTGQRAECAVGLEAHAATVLA